MYRLRHSELDRFSRVIRELTHSPAPDPGALSEHLLRAIARLIPVDRVSYNEVEGSDRGGRVRRAHSMGEPPAPGLVASLNAHLHEHPGFHWPDRDHDWPAPMKISDALSQREFRRLGLYQEHFRLYGIHYQLGASFRVASGGRISFGLNRQRRDFSEEERLLLTLLRPHLAEMVAHREALTEMRAALELREAALAAMPAVVLLGADGTTILYLTESARALLRRYFPDARSAATGDGPAGLPAELAHWVNAGVHPSSAAASPGAGGLPSPPPPGSAVRTWWLPPRRAGRRLLLSLVHAGRGRRLLRLTERASEPSVQPLQALGLTAREAEVLLWLAQGKRNAEIATICGLQPMTAATHVRNVLGKLGCETRTAAAALAWEVLGEVTAMGGEA